MKSQAGDDEMQHAEAWRAVLVKDQWQMGEVDVDGWGGGPLSPAQNAA